MKEPVKFGDYYLFERVAVGGMAEVFKAVSYGVEAFERLVAVKRVLPSISEDQEFIDMFIDEAKIAVQLSHANIGQIFDLGNAEESYFIAMEFVPGKDARAVFDRSRNRKERLDISMCCHVVKSVCEALEYAHNKTNNVGSPINLIHRDVSPQNILLGYDGEVKLIDFGIAKAAGKANKTQAGILKGKFGYMSPEQVRGKPIDKRSDVFSLAVVLYELLTTERCFQGEDDFSTLENVRKVNFKRPTLLNRSIPPELERILYRGLTRNPEDRFQSAAEFQDALQKFLYQSGSFYSRRDLSSYMRETFAKEFNAETDRLTKFRKYARRHIPEARRPDSLPLDLHSVNMHEDASNTEPLQDGFLAEDESTESLSIVESTASLSEELHESSVSKGQPKNEHFSFEDEPVPSDIVLLTSASRGGYPSEAPTIPRDHGDAGVKEMVVDDKSRLFWLAAITILAVIIGVFTVMYSAEFLAPATIRIETSPPRVQVYLDGQLAHDDQTPIRLANLTTGTHWVVVSSPGYASQEKQIELTSGQEFVLKFTLKRDGSQTQLMVESEPGGAQVFLDGAPFDQTPLTMTDAPVGAHELRLERDGHLPWSGKINLTAGEKNHLPLIRLYPKAISLTVIPEPDSAVVELIDETGVPKKFGPGPQTIQDVSNSGKIKVVAHAAGFQRIERILEQSYENRRTEILELKPAAQSAKPLPGSSSKTKKANTAAESKASTAPKLTGAANGWLKLVAKPAAKVFIDGVYWGWSPIVDKSLSPGRHVILLLRDKAPAYRQTLHVEIEAGKTTLQKYAHRH